MIRLFIKDKEENLSAFQIIKEKIKEIERNHH